MLLKEIISHLESLAPPSYQESYDNSGLLVGNKKDEVKAILIALDCIEITIDEAIEKAAMPVAVASPVAEAPVAKGADKKVDD